MNNSWPKFLLIGNGAYSNKGCEAIVRGTVDILTQRFPKAKFFLSSFGKTTVADAKCETDSRIEHKIPKKGITRFDIVWWKYGLFFKLFPQLRKKYLYSVQLNAMKEADCALEIGGDNYSLDYGTPTRLLHMDNILLSTGKPLILWGASIGPFTKNIEIEQLMKKHLQRFTLIYARESETLAYLSSIGIRENVKLLADPAFIMRAKKPVLKNDLSSFLERRPIGLNLSPLVGRFRHGSNRERWREEVRRYIEDLLAWDMGPILLVPHVFNEGNNDYEFMKQAAVGLPGWGQRLTILPPNLKAEEYKWVISRLRAFAGARTHTTIAALSSYVPTLSIGYSMKARGINKDIFGHLDWLIPITELSSDALLKKMSDLLFSEQSIRQQLEAAIPNAKARALSAADYLKDILSL